MIRNIQNEMQKANVSKFQIKEVRNEICRSLAGINPASDTIPLIRSIGTMGQEAFLHYLDLSIQYYDLPPSKRNLTIFDKMSANEYIALGNLAEANGILNKGGKKNE